MALWDIFGNKQIKKLRAVIEENPDAAEAHFELGTLYEAKNRLPEATREFQETLRLHSRSAEAHFNLGVLYEKSGDGKNAIVHMNKAGTLFAERGDEGNKERARKRLRDYYNRFGFKAEDIADSG